MTATAPPLKWSMEAPPLSFPELLAPTGVTFGDSLKVVDGDGDGGVEAGTWGGLR